MELRLCIVFSCARVGARVGAFGLSFGRASVALSGRCAITGRID